MNCTLNGAAKESSAVGSISGSLRERFSFMDANSALIAWRSGDPDQTFGQSIVVSEPGAAPMTYLSLNDER